MNLNLVTVTASDGIELPGLLYKPTQQTKKVAVWLHGMGDNGIFYNPNRINALGTALTSKGIALLAFNNRGAHNSKSLRRTEGSVLLDEDKSYRGGTHYEKIIDCIKDIDGAVSYLKNDDFTEFYLIGHSTGANKICAYHVHAKLNVFSKYILAGPGDDVGLFYTELGVKKFWHALDYAKQTIDSDMPFKLMPRYSGMYPFSAQSAWDILNPNGDYNTFPYFEFKTERLGTKSLFKEYKQIDRPTLVIFGEEDEYTYTAGTTADALGIFIKQSTNSMLKTTDFQLVPGADHGFHGFEKEFAESVTLWLSKK
jgi:pimeloyl-ACP methyl ester carboxylesterase